MLRLTAVVLAATLAIVQPLVASTESAALRARGFALAYNLDHEQALAALNDAVKADPSDPASYRGLAAIVWLNLGFRRGTVTVDSFLGPGRSSRVWKPPPDLVALFRENADRALAIARRQVQAAPLSADAHYQVGATVGLMASYMATIEARLFGAMSAAKEAFDEQERVLKLDSTRADAGLTVGVYRYVISELSLPLRLMAYVRGFGGDKEKGLRFIEAAAHHPSEAQTDARLALVLIYNREREYDKALQVLADLRRQYPRNRLFWLEAGATLLRAGRHAEADTMLSDGLLMIERDTRPRMFGEAALWHYKRGLARAKLGQRELAERDLTESTVNEGRDWVHGRARLELGRLAASRGDANRARRELTDAIRLGDGDNDPDTAAQARTLLKELTP